MFNHLFMYIKYISRNTLKKIYLAKTNISRTNIDILLCICVEVRNNENSNNVWFAFNYCILLCKFPQVPRVVELWSFQAGGTKLERFLPKNQTYQRTLLYFEFWINGKLSKSAKIWLSKSIFYVKIIRIFFLFFHWRISI